MTQFIPSTRIDTAKNKLQWNVRFLPVPHAVLGHPTFHELSGNAAKLLLAILAAYKGDNNGHLTATHSLMKRRGFNSKDSLARGLRELISSGYIIRTRVQYLRSAALYAVTWLPINQPPTGQSYDVGVTAGEEATDLWRDTNLPNTKCAT
ncbi:helix-turn-helix domain-containing protein [Lysobacter sp. A378]